MTWDLSEVREWQDPVGHPRRVDFNQGVDARILVKSPMFLREMATICIDPLRIAFDHIGLRRVYERAMRMAADQGITTLSNYMLYNFMDSPEDLYARMRLNIVLNQELGVRIWSFPMRYQPVTQKDRGHVGKRWNRYYLRSFQVMLQATRGVVSGNPEFFERAFGRCEVEFEALLGLPHAFLFHRDFFERDEGFAARERYEALRARLSDRQRAELMAVLMGRPGEKRLVRSYYGAMAEDATLDLAVRRLLPFHALSTGEEAKRAGMDVLRRSGWAEEDGSMPSEEQAVEDAGLYEVEV